LTIGDPLDPAVNVGPVLDQKTREAAMACIAAAGPEARLALAMDQPEDAARMPGRCHVPPHIFADVPATAALARESCPGPVLAVMPAASFEKALQIATADHSLAALGLHSRTPSNIDRARSESGVSLLFINRPVERPAVGEMQTEEGTAIDSARHEQAHLHRFLDPSIADEQALRGAPFMADEMTRAGEADE
jgi:acyl-CoA reductase-like NAD-dependent aldehyde dehydrogenase